MAYINLAAATKTARATALNTAIGTSAIIEIRTGSPPATPDTAVTGTLLGTLTGNASAFGTVSGSVLTAGTITQDSSADSTGVAGYCRIKTSGGTAIVDVDISTTAAGTGTMLMNTTSIVTGGPIQITSCTFTEA